MADNKSSGGVDLGRSHNMEIPEELKKFLTLDKVEKQLDLVSGIVDPEKKGNAISHAALGEEEITMFLLDTPSLARVSDRVVRQTVGLLEVSAASMPGSPAFADRGSPAVGN
jgi:hypothetical protein